MPANPHTAILLFSRTAEAEAQAKSFGAGEIGDLRIAERLLRRTEATIATAGLPIIRVDEKKQRGASFGAKLSAALAAAFGLGYENLIVVGNDAPGLRTAHLRLAARALAEGRNIVVPDRRGGISLLGINRSAVRETDIAGLSWETNRLFFDLAVALPGADVLPAIADINCLADLRTVWRFIRGRLSGVSYLLLRRVLVSFENTLFTFFHYPVIAGRGPPVSD